MLSLVGDRTAWGCTFVLTTQCYNLQSALSIWEYLITLASEVDLFWRKPVTAPSMLFIVTRWIMLANAFGQFIPITEAMFDSMPLLCMSDIDTFLSNCEAMIWAGEVLYLAGFIVIARKQAHFTSTSLLRALTDT